MLYRRNLVSPRRSWSLVTAPPVLPLTAAQFKEWERVDVADEDSTVDALIQAATDLVDGPYGWLGRCIVQQTWDMKLDGFPPSGVPIAIPQAELRDVTSITYIDPAGDLQTLDSAGYQVVGVGNPAGGFIAEAWGQSWPATRDVYEAVTVRFVAGFAPDTSTSPDDYRANIPEAIRRALAMIAGYNFENREDTQDIRPSRARAMLLPYRAHWAF